MSPQTLYDKLWASHVVHAEDDGTTLLYIDRHLVHEVTSPQAYEGLKLAGRKVWRPESVVATADHNTPTRDWDHGIADPTSRAPGRRARPRTSQEYGAKAYFPFLDRNQGIVHVIGPEHGATLPGMTVVCGDSHTSTHGAFACLAHGIGTSEVEHVLATQCLVTKKSRNMLVLVEGRLGRGVTAKDIALAIIGRIGTAGGTGYAIEYAGAAMRALSMEGRMTLCNMSIEAGARCGMVAVDDTTINYLKGRQVRAEGRRVGARRRGLAHAGQRRQRQVRPRGDPRRARDQAAGHLGHLARDGAAGRRARTRSGQGARRDQARRYRACAQVHGARAEHAADRRSSSTRSSSAPAPIRASRTCARRRRWCADAGSRPTSSLAMVVPGSGPVKEQAEREGLDRIFRDAGFEWREPGCSMCLGMNDDKLSPGERCASTSNRNFEGRQGPGGRTHLVSPEMAAAAAISGHFVDVRNWS